MQKERVVLNVTQILKTPGSGRQFVDALEQAGLLRTIRAEAGCLQYEFFTSLDDPGKLILVERWTDEEALATHAASGHMEKFAAIKADYVADTDLVKFIL